ncbi:MAG: glucose-6-phosphate isomerase [Rhodobacteraceae bacterium]|nr:glucose-6-phosphate isomerase [Paracoccaceae bacterium]
MRMMALAAAASLALAACAGMTPEERMVVGGLAGATAGLIAADALNANRNWTIFAALAGAAAGTLVARNSVTGQCAYAVGDGTYRTGPCPT